MVRFRASTGHKHISTQFLLINFPSFIHLVFRKVVSNEFIEFYEEPGHTLTPVMVLSTKVVHFPAYSLTPTHFERAEAEALLIGHQMRIHQYVSREGYYTEDYEAWTMEVRG